MYHMRNGLSSSGGAHIVIEEAPELPDVLSDGTSIASGTDTKISLKTHVIQRLEDPYGSHCENKIINKEVKLRYPPEFKYSAKSCANLCYVVNAHRECNCYIPSDVGGVMLTQYDSMSKGLNRCKSKKQLECIRELAHTYKHCDCRPECHDIIYQVTASTRLF